MFGIYNFFIRRRRGRRAEYIDPDFVLIDSENLPQFDTHQFEGRMEKPISKNVFVLIGSLFALVIIIFLSRFWFLQVLNGEKYRETSENNKLKEHLIIAPRGNIYSRDGVELAYNQITENESNFPLRKYIDLNGFSSLVGFVKYPAKDSAGFYYEEDFIAKDGAEEYFNEVLSGRNGVELIETSVTGDVVSKNKIRPGSKGEDVVLSIDSRIQNKMYEAIKDLSAKVGFRGGAGIIMDVESGEILSMVTYPEYSSQIMTDGEDIKTIQSYFKDTRNPFLNRVVSGLYTPGSIVKPFLAFAALEEKIISPQKEIVSTGRLVVPNPYNKDAPTIFKDWKAHGATDMRRAIAVSSDVYFYQIGGGFESQKGLGILNIKKYLESFGFTKNTGFSDEEAAGIIPDPEWKSKTFKGEVWRVGDTYNSAIGQYGTQVTPIQSVVAVSALANYGKRVTPSLLFTSTSTVVSGIEVKGDRKNFDIAREGMQMAVEEGTAIGLNINGLNVAGKTGTAELGAKKDFVNSWVIGFFPYEKPKYAFTVVMERGPVHNTLGATYIMRQVLDFMMLNTKEYINN